MDKFRAMVEEVIDRRLTDAELAPQVSLATLSQPVRDIVNAIADCAPLCAAYLRGLMPDVRLADINDFIDELGHWAR